MSKRNLESVLRSPVPDENASAARRDWRDRAALWLPWLLLIGFAAIVWSMFGGRLLPARPVTVEPVVTLRDDQAPVSAPASGDPFQSEMLFQASGWIEPDPLPVKATALVSGVVRSVEVLEGQAVEKGQLLATLIDDDARLDLETARNDLASLQAQQEAHHGEVAVAEAEVETMSRQIAAAQARLAELGDIARRFEKLPAGSLPAQEVSQARLKVATQEAEIAALEAQKKERQSRVTKLLALAKDIEARLAAAKTEVARRELVLSRTRIVSPVDGVVLRLLALPGQKRMLEMDEEDSATIAILFEPGHLQARIDVPLEEASKLAVGQAVRVRSNFLPDADFRGQVTRIVGEADIGRNTLQAKVRIANPDPRLRPEMLCRAEFLAPQTASGGEKPGDGRVRVYVSPTALLSRNGDQAEVWRWNPSTSRIEKVSIQLARGTRDGYEPVDTGLLPGDRVVLNPPSGLRPGQRVKAQTAPAP